MQHHSLQAGEVTTHHLANTWDISLWSQQRSHVPHHCPMRRSSEPQRTRRVLLAACGYFLPLWLSSSLSHSPSLLLGSYSAQSWGQIVKYVLSKMMQEVQVIIVFSSPGVTHCLHFLVSFTGPFYNMTPEERIDADNRSVYVGNVRMIYLRSSY